jgi:hypothetical protein
MNSTTTPCITPRQEAFILDLLREAFPADDPQDRMILAAFNGAFASPAATRRSIDKLIEHRDAARKAARATRPVEETVSIPAGHYALRSRTVEDGWDFYKVVEGRNPGVRFVNRFRSDYLDRMTWSAQREVLAAIAERGADQAGYDFAHELECCRRCARTLTDIPTARKNGGYGPECVKKVAA